MTLRAPFPYFGGKSAIADNVWRRFGVVDNYVEPFCGSCAVLLARPLSFECVETVNDIDAYLANFWRAVQSEPETVANLLNWPVNECDLEARHKWLVAAARKAEHRERMRDDPHYYDAKIAAWWCWGLCSWIGRGWCAGTWYGRGSDENQGSGINVRDEQRGGKLPHLSAGHGVHRKLPHLSAGHGVHRQRPHLGTAGHGVHRQRPHLGTAGQGECERRLEVLVDWMRALRDRLRNVRVCCGDWSRVCGATPTIKQGVTAIFLDPPYSADAGRDNEVYSHESGTVAHDVRNWCLQNGDNKMLRIALCGYEGEGHEELSRNGWRVESWTAHGGYGHQRAAKTGAVYKNRYRERIWYSPYCVGETQHVLFGNGHALDE